jgi:curved DNA-binding protein CbpA
MKDFYRILGVINTAEDVVIKAAYRALAQRYHPDKFDGDPATAEARMQEINEAYSVLSDPEKRSGYDASFDYYNSSNNNPSQNEEDFFAGNDFEEMWKEVIEFYPDLERITADLKKISSRLVQTFKYYLLETKQYTHRTEISRIIEKNYLESYFGKNEEIIRFGRVLILLRLKIAAKRLNRAVSLFGNNADPNIIINKIKKNDLSQNENLLVRLINKETLYVPDYLVKNMLSENFEPLYAKRFIQELGGDLTWKGSPEKQYYLWVNDFSGSPLEDVEIKDICKQLALVIG